MGFVEAIIGDNPVQWLFVGIIVFLIFRGMSGNNSNNGASNSGNNSSASAPS